MADFITRISLLGDNPPPFDELDRAMSAHNFTRLYVSARGVTYKLPEGTYFSQSFTMFAADVRNLAAAVVHQLGWRYDIVTISGEIACFLHPAR